MKRTNSMIIERTIESHELYLFAINCADLANMYNAITENLQKKIDKATYNHEKAIDGYYPLMTEASKIYYKWYGYKFDVKQRFNASDEAVEALEIDNDLQ